MSVLQEASRRGRARGGSAVVRGVAFGPEVREVSLSADRARSFLGRCVVVLALTLMTFGLGWAGHVAAQEVPVALRTAILLRALAYEKGFASGSERAKIVVVGAGKASSEVAGVSAAISQLTESGGRKISVIKHAQDLTDEALKGLEADVVYVAAGSDASLAVARRSKLVVLCGNPRDVGKGCVLSVESAGRSSRLVIDLNEAERKGLRFDARMLRLARVIR